MTKQEQEILDGVHAQLQSEHAAEPHKFAAGINAAGIWALVQKFGPVVVQALLPLITSGVSTATLIDVATKLIKGLSAAGIVVPPPAA